LNKNGQIIDVVDPVALQIFQKSIHNNSFALQDRCLQISKDNLPPGSKNLDFAYPPEVMAVNGKGDGQQAKRRTTAFFRMKFRA